MRAKMFSRPIPSRQILPRWIDMLSPAVLSAAALAFLLSFGHPTTHSSMQAVPPRVLSQTGAAIETVLICAMPHADSPAARPFASGSQPILCTFKPL